MRSNNQPSRFNNYFLKNQTLCRRYLIEKPIFQNNCFINYLAFDKYIESRIIIKEFFPKTIATRKINTDTVLIERDNIDVFNNLKKNFMQTYKVLQQFKVRPNIIKIYSVFEENNTCYCVHELPQGFTLKKVLSNNYGELSWNHSKSMFLDLISFLQNLHNSNILHCNLSPETIIVCNNKLKIIDFSNTIFNGKVFNLEPKLHDGYCAIEQYNNSKIDTFTDVYSVAAIIYKSLTGTKPISSNSRLLNDNLLPPENLNITIPKNVSISIMSALILSPKLRTQTMNDFYDDLIAHSREFYKNPAKLTEFSTHINTIEPIKPPKIKKNKKQVKELPTHSLIFITMLISASTLFFTAAIIIFILFHDSFFK